MQTMDEIDVAIKTCKEDASSEDKDKFLEEACEFMLYLWPLHLFITCVWTFLQTAPLYTYTTGV